jgi:transcriptional regulator with XRE-family HTH domain
MSYQFDIGEKGRKVARFLGRVRRELQAAVDHEKTTRKLTQQQIAQMIGVNRSVINRQLLGGENLTLRRVAELAWALGWDIVFELRKPTIAHGQNELPIRPFASASTTSAAPKNVLATAPKDVPLARTKASDSAIDRAAAA